MTDRERILTSIRGEAPDRLPWVPRLEFWHRARLRNGTLPAELRGLSLIEITAKLGIGHYHVVPDFTDCPNEDDMVDRALGIFRLPVLPYKTTFDGVDRRVIRRGRETVIEYHTPVGSIRTATIFTDEMLDAGASVPWTTEHPLQQVRDFDIVGYIFEHLCVEPQVEGYLKLREQVGNRGLVIGYVSGMACPMQHIMKELMPTERFFYAMADYPDQIERLCARMEPYYQGMRDVAAASAAEVVLLGANYDDSITYPPFFKEHLLPPLKSYADQLHSRGKYLMTHTDGENRRLMPLYLEAGFDIADSVCPYPMTRLTLDDFLNGFRGRITIWGGIPSVLLCHDSATESDFRAWIDDLLARHGRTPRFVLGVSDMVTADAEWGRLQYISEKVEQLPSRAN